MEKAMKELRFTELRALDDDTMTIEGYACVFDSITDLGYWYEVVSRDAFEECDMSDVCMKYNHEDNMLIMARTRNGSLQLYVDDHGLKMRASLIDTTQNRDLYKMIQARLLDKMSFAFVVKEASWEFDHDGTGKDLRKILKIDKLFDVSVVDVPAYESTDVYTRSKEQIEKEKEAVKSEIEFELEKEKLKLKLSL